MVRGKQGPLGFTPKRIVAVRFVLVLCLQAQYLFWLGELWVAVGMSFLLCI